MTHCRTLKRFIISTSFLGTQYKTKAEEDLIASLLKELSDPKAFIYKATLKDTDHIVGFAHCYLKDGEGEAAPRPLNEKKRTIFSLLQSKTQKKYKDLFAHQKH